MTALLVTWVVGTLLVAVEREIGSRVDGWA
jgi:hypothetical protein